MSNPNTCAQCNKTFFGDKCFLCANKKAGKKEEVDFRNGLCHYNHHGEYCVLTGSTTFETGPHRVTKWFCSYHLHCSDKEMGMKIIRWGKQYWKEILITRKFPVWNNPPRACKPVIVNGPPDTFRAVYEDYVKFCNSWNASLAPQLLKN